MRSTTYSAVERGVASTAGINPTSILAHERVMIAEYINDAIRYCWDYYPWAEFTITEKRYFRDSWDSTKTYSIGDEVYHSGKYFRMWSTASQDNGTIESPDVSLTQWYEIGDTFADTDWSENATYKIGARVKYNDKSYICIARLDGGTASGLKWVNYEYDSIDPTNTNFFSEVDTTFDRYIPYESEGEETIGTIISVHVDDPRYNDSPPINWREGREGVYISKLAKEQAHVWVKYRKESPVYSTDAPDEKVPNFLVPAIKAYAYKSWLIGNGQHEKAMLQDIAGLDLLVREVDKLNSQQDRGLPYTIPSEPYRRLNARGSLITEETKAQIGGIKKGLGELTFKFKNTATGRNAVKSSSTEIDTEIAPEVSGRQIVKSSEVIPFSPSVWTIIIGQGNVSKKGSADIKFTITTGKSHRKIPVGYINGYKYAFCLATIDLDTHNLNGYNAVVYQGGEADASVLASEISGYNAVKYRDNNEIDFTILSSDLSGRQVKRESGSEINFALESDQSFTRIRGRVINPSPDLVVSVDDSLGKQVARFGTLDADISLNFDIVVASWASSASFDDLNISWEKGT